MALRNSIQTQQYIDLLRRSAQNFDLENFAFGINFKNKMPDQLHCTYRTDWQQHYHDNNMIMIDPVVIEGLRGSTTMTWLELSKAHPKNAVLSRATDFDMHDGIIMPITLPNHKSVLSFSQTNPNRKQAEIDIIHTLATYAARTYNAGERDDCPLTLSQLVTLQMVAEGHLQADIGTAFGIGRHGVRQHLNAAFKKLDARNASHAVHLAHQRRLID